VLGLIRQGAENLSKQKLAVIGGKLGTFPHSQSQSGRETCDFVVVYQSRPPITITLLAILLPLRTNAERRAAMRSKWRRTEIASGTCVQEIDKRPAHDILQ
jgi:hypothetical protein